MTKGLDDYYRVILLIINLLKDEGECEKRILHPHMKTTFMDVKLINI